MLVLNNI